MTGNHGATSCRWAGLTLYLPYPAWLASEDTPWSCVRKLPPRPLDTTDACLTCPGWEPRPEAINDHKPR